jgi:hypothetical protein
MSWVSSRCLLVVLFAIFATQTVNCWESYEMDLFDLVEDVGQNFYELFDVKQVNHKIKINIIFRNIRF